MTKFIKLHGDLIPLDLVGRALFFRDEKKRDLYTLLGRDGERLGTIAREELDAAVRQLMPAAAGQTAYVITVEAYDEDKDAIRPTELEHTRVEVHPIIAWAFPPGNVDPEAVLLEELASNQYGPFIAMPDGRVAEPMVATYDTLDDARRKALRHEQVTWDRMEWLEQEEEKRLEQEAKA